MCSLQVSSDINRKFKELELLLVSQVKNLSQELNGYSEEMIVRHIMKIGKLYRMISSIVESQNDIFGGVIMLMIWHSLVQILRCVNFLLLNWEQTQCLNVYVCLLTAFSMITRSTGVRFLLSVWKFFPSLPQQTAKLGSLEGQY
ncbi:unnamed protein product [Acanthoscelides obtectus]|uniref:Uncharacterized protein n=1 Tax=Acanthoscelides obtectus TaxID=200917 RepID=A0A9P0LVX9_ACAOB|nr:unnamed protein product [Acanthoscelides obtectus]CAK1649685.1 hypothetical protein AOBTE_LOCUS16356 [Acanthoscelides obtectus]